MGDNDTHGSAVEIRQLKDRLRVLSEATRSFAEKTTDYQGLLDGVSEKLAEILHDTCSVMLLSPDEQALEVFSVHAPTADLAAQIRQMLSDAPLNLAEHPVLERVVRTGETLLIPRLPAREPTDPKSEKTDYERIVKIHSLLVVALRLHGKSIGIISLSRYLETSPPFSDQDRDLAQTLADHAALAIGNARAYIEAQTSRAQLLSARSRFANLEESGLLGILLYRATVGVVEVNDTLLSIIGYTREEVLAPDFAWMSLTPPEWKDLDARAAKELAASGVAELREKEYIRKDGSRTWVIIGSANIQGTGDIISFVLDINERKISEERARLAAMVDSSHDAIIGCNVSGDMTSWNKGAERMFGYSAAEAIGRSITLLLPPERQARKAMVLERVRRGVVEQFDTVLATKDGDRIDVSVTNSPVHDSSGSLIGASNVARDVTERKRVEAVLAQSQEATELANRELEAFSYSVAHDLRAPLRGMNGFARVLLDDYADQLDADGRDALNEIIGNAERMAELIDALLSLSRLARSTLHRTPVDLTAIATGIATKLASANPSCEVELAVAPGLVADADLVLTGAIFENLLENAWKFSGRATRPRVEVGKVEQEGVPVFFVKDNGAGFDMAFADKLFAPFQRLHAASEFKGTGIGLANVQRIVHRHGGKVWAESKVGRGATFYFTLPNRKPEGAS